jgi:hypothetical protein
MLLLPFMIALMVLIGRTVTAGMIAINAIKLRKNIYHINRPSGAKPTIFIGSVGFASFWVVYKKP